ncbi:valine-tRNA ligase [Batrachochytrium salamandrivorans]|nr:valine-tRNA ligase [Batrachochytrium salamandrivorans]
MRRVVSLAQAYQPPPTAPITNSAKNLLNKPLDQVYLFPPPNVTGKLHMGHALTVTIQDSAVRFQRLLGRQVRWIFGTDHAGIATQTVVEKQLAKRTNPATGKPTTRHDLGRQQFVGKVKEWTDEHKQKISTQLKLLGATLDFDNEYFTLDEFHSQAVEHAFVTLHERGLLHRKLRMVNYCYQLETCLSDLEVDQMQVSVPTEYKLPGSSGEMCRLGVADDFAYPIVGGCKGEEIVVRTTRLETMWGDVAVAVHPDDLRWSKYIGRKVQHPLLPHKQLPVIADPVLVDMGLGTGAVKVTPFHDENDFECAQRNHLPLGNSLYDDKGRMSQLGGEESLSRFEMRAKLRKELGSLGLYRGEVPHAMAIPVCSRTGDVIERTLKYQWFLDASTLSQRANMASSHNRMTFAPPESEHVYRDWLVRCGDWCVSRQLWWGHRIPAYRKRGTGESNWIVCNSLEQAQQRLGTTEVEQDEDVLDTWFSSGLLPLSISGWPNTTLDSSKPLLTWMETGSDILFFWVARMAMLSVELGQVLPFGHVHLHALVRDGKGRKMSKSLGNVIDPMDVIQGVSFQDLCGEIERGNLTKREQATALLETKQNFPKGIASFGSDALRLALASYAGSQTITFDLASVVSARLFCNKLWQAGRFVAHKLETAPEAVVSKSTTSLADQWIVQRLCKAQEVCHKAYGSLDCDLASTTARKFVLEDLCDVYIECNKLHPNNALLVQVFQSSLVLLNPVMPNITNDLWQAFFPEQEMQWIPTVVTGNDGEDWIRVEREMATCLDVCRAVRALKLRFPHQREFQIVSGEGASSEVVDLTKRLTRVDALVWCPQQQQMRDQQQPGAMVEALGDARGYVEAVGSGLGNDVDLASERKRQQDELERIAKRQLAVSKEMASLEQRLHSPAFVAKAPAVVLDREKRKLLDCQNEFQVLETARVNLSNAPQRAR